MKRFIFVFIHLSIINIIDQSYVQAEQQEHISFEDLKKIGSNIVHRIDFSIQYKTMLTFHFR